MASCCSSSPVQCPASTEVAPASGDSVAMDWFRFALAAVIGGQSMVFGLAVNLSPPDAMTRLILHGILAASAIAVFLVAGRKLTSVALQAAYEGRWVFEQMFLLGTTGAFAASVMASLTGSGSIYYDVVAVLIAIHALGTALGRSRQSEAFAAAGALASQFDFCRRLNADGSMDRVSSNEIKAGDRIRVLAGEGVPVDGRLEQGRALVRTAAFSGEPFPVSVLQGDLLYAGYEAVDADLVLIAESGGGKRRLDAILQGVREALAKPSSLQKQADQLVEWFLPAVVVLALLTFAGWSNAQGWQDGMLKALAVLVVACPCAMGLATPIAVWSAVNALAAQGIVCSTGDFIERLAGVNAVVFDKTGTLGEEKLSVSDFRAEAGFDPGTLRSWVAALQSRSDHPYARAFHSWNANGLTASEVMQIPGVGVEGLVEGRRIKVGNFDSGMATEKKHFRSMADLQQQLESSGRELGIWVDQQPAALVQLRESLRESVGETRQGLSELGFRVEVMTGDPQAKAAAFEGWNLTAGMSPETKRDGVRRLQESGYRVLFVGDGVNDAAAMATAHASLAISTGTRLAVDSAQAVLVSTHLAAIPVAVRLCRQTVRGIRNNLYFAALYNLAGIGLAASGLLHPIAAALLMLMASSTVSWRALRAAAKLKDGNLEGAHKLSMKTVSAKQQDEIVLAPVSPFLPRITALGFFIQGALLGWLGRLPLPSVLALAVALGLAGWMIARVLFGPRRSFVLASTFAMLAFGNVGMLVGWWADAGFHNIVSATGCLCGCSKSLSAHSTGHGWWSHLGMVIASAPAVLWIRPVQVNIRDRLSHGFNCLAGMLLGMFGFWMAAGQFSTGSPQLDFALTFLSMTLGMFMGMLVACRLWAGWVLKNRSKR